MKNIKQELLKEFNIKFGRSPKAEVVLLDTQREAVEKWLSSSFGRYTRAVIDEIMPAEKDILIPQSEVENAVCQAHKGFNACLSEIKRRAEELIKIKL
mgnify:CR=1 FL=1